MKQHGCPEQLRFEVKSTSFVLLLIQQTTEVCRWRSLHILYFFQASLHLHLCYIFNIHSLLEVSYNYNILPLTQCWEIMISNLLCLVLLLLAHIKKKSCKSMQWSVLVLPASNGRNNFSAALKMITQRRIQNNVIFFSLNASQLSISCSCFLSKQKAAFFLLLHRLFCSISILLDSLLSQAFAWGGKYVSVDMGHSQIFSCTWLCCLKVCASPDFVSCTFIVWLCNSWLFTLVPFSFCILM